MAPTSLPFALSYWPGKLPNCHANIQALRSAARGPSAERKELLLKLPGTYASAQSAPRRRTGLLSFVPGGTRIAKPPMA
jgi:hypothetical protein